MPRKNICENCRYCFKTDIRQQRKRIYKKKTGNEYTEVLVSSRVIKCVQKSLCLDNLSVSSCNSFKQKFQLST